MSFKKISLTSRKLKRWCEAKYDTLKHLRWDSKGQEFLLAPKHVLWKWIFSPNRQPSWCSTEWQSLWWRCKLNLPQVPFSSYGGSNKSDVSNPVNLTKQESTVTRIQHRKPGLEPRHQDRAGSSRQVRASRNHKRQNLDHFTDPATATRSADFGLNCRPQRNELS